MTTNGENYATVVKPGVCPIATDYLQIDISPLKNKVDHIIVVLHWGEENFYYPTPDQIAIAHRAIDLGASASLARTLTSYRVSNATGTASSATA